MSRGRGLLAALLLALGASCRTSRTYLAQPGAYDRLEDEELDRLRTPRVLADSGRLAEAHEALVPLARAAPRNLRIAAFLQELEVALLRAGGSARGLRLEPGGDARAELFRAYLRRAQEVPTSEAWVLAARLAGDPDRSIELLEQALALDGANPWAHYGTAWAHASRGRYSQARKALERAFAVDPGHLPSIRLDGALLARAGEAGRAALAFEGWLARSILDPTVDPRERASVRLDLSILYVLEDEPSEALALLEAVEVGAPEREARVELVRAAAFQALGATEEARRAVRNAGEAAGEELLVAIDEALLAGARGDPDGEREAWTRALAVAEGEEAEHASAAHGPADFRSILVRLQALARLGRLGAVAP